MKENKEFIKKNLKLKEVYNNINTINYHIHELNIDDVTKDELIKMVTKLKSDLISIY